MNGFFWVVLLGGMVQRGMQWSRQLPRQVGCPVSRDLRAELPAGQGLDVTKHAGPVGMWPAILAATRR